MTELLAPVPRAHQDHHGGQNPTHTHTPGPARPPILSWVVGLVCLALALRVVADTSVLRTWSTVALAVVLQALPFLVLGVVLSGAVAAYVPPGLLPRLIPRNPLFAVPLASVSGLALPGCECSSVPVANRLITAGAPPAAAFTFMLSAPAINPVVVVATSVAFPGQPRVVVARVLASLLAAMVVGLVWSRWGAALMGSGRVIACPAEHVHAGSRLSALRSGLVEDFSGAAGWLVVGAATAASLQVLVPRSVLDTLSSGPVLPVLVLAVLAVLLAVCSEADAFVAAGLSQFSLTARLAFLTVGPMTDVKLIALQAGAFGRRFVLRFAPLTFVVAVASASLVGAVLL